MIHEPDKLEENGEDKCRTQQDGEQPEAKWELSIGAHNSTSIIDSSNTNRAEKLASQKKRARSAKRRPEEPTMQTQTLELKDVAHKVLQSGTRSALRQINTNHKLWWAQQR